jgi:hypothetical protein
MMQGKLNVFITKLPDAKEQFLIPKPCVHKLLDWFLCVSSGTVQFSLLQIILPLVQPG